jgi:hypothetical protein
MASHCSRIGMMCDGHGTFISKEVRRRSREKGLPEMMRIGGGVSNFEYGRRLLLLFLSVFIVWVVCIKGEIERR